MPSVGRKNKYHTHVAPYLDVIKAWCRRGATDQFIAEKLGISVARLYVYKKQFREFREALLTNKEFADLEVENALHQLAVGRVFEEVKESTSTDAGRTHEGEREERTNVVQKKHVTTTRKLIKPDFRAICKWLAARQPEKWGKDVRNREDLADEQLTAMYEAMTPEERREMLRELRTGGGR